MATTCHCALLALDSLALVVFRSCSTAGVGRKAWPSSCLQSTSPYVPTVTGLPAAGITAIALSFWRDKGFAKWQSRVVLLRLSTWTTVRGARSPSNGFVRLIRSEPVISFTELFAITPVKWDEAFATRLRLLPVSPRSPAYIWVAACGWRHSPVCRRSRIRVRQQAELRCPSTKQLCWAGQTER